MSDRTRNRNSNQLIGDEIKANRTAAGISQAELAGLVRASGLKCHNTTVAKIELGERTISFEEAVVFARALGVPVADLARPIAEGGPSNIVIAQKMAKVRAAQEQLDTLKAELASIVEEPQ